MTSNKLAIMHPEQYYHVFNRTNGAGRLFFSDRNFKFFLRRLGQYGKGFWETCAYALLSNHFHLVIRICPQDVVMSSAAPILDNVLRRSAQLGHRWKFQEENIRNPLESEDVDFQQKLCHLLVAEQMRRFLLSYSKAINKQQSRHGSLLQKIFKRKMIPIEDVAQVVMYVHRNPVHHGYVRKPDDYKWSSYDAYIKDIDSKFLSKWRVLDLFDGADNLQLAHEAYNSNTLEINNLEVIL